MATRIVYVGPFDGVEIADTGQYVGRGEEVEIEDNDLAENLLTQSIWARPTTKAAEHAAKVAKRANPASKKEEA